ncbi:DNA-binding transcriptional MerR regulator [Bacillus ectoiniformans]|uniref:hypothetical protein n=1 Tax=Bacillus ectoiniformans TaxID=1494429 RepID=UPI0019577D91|nr:hypothetical protein [Bacillus ectoiniformans]MBM7649434.1 DNA-binding transcriptional MerR regulator [Bacillus ectoiniformans]
MEQAFFSSEVAKSLGVGASTLRKYSLALESAGYHFDRGINNSRVFYQKDVITMQRLIKAVNEQNMSLDSAIQLAVEHQPKPIDEPVQAAAVKQEPEELLNRIARLEEQQETLIEVNKELIKELAQHQRWMKEKMELQETAVRDRLLLTGLQPQKVERPAPVYSLPSLFSIFRRKKKEASF